MYLALFLLAALVGWSFLRVSVQDSALAREVLATRTDIGMLEAQQAALKADVATRRTDAYLEQKARELGYVRPGEGLASVRDARPEPSAATPASAPSRLERWLALLFRP